MRGVVRGDVAPDRPWSLPLLPGRTTDGVRNRWQRLDSYGKGEPGEGAPPTALRMDAGGSLRLEAAVPLARREAEGRAVREAQHAAERGP